MRRYAALVAPDGAPADPDAWRLERTGFSWLAFLFSVPWLLFQRLWLAAIAILLVPVAIGMGLGEGPGFVASLAAGLIAGAEGRGWRVAKWERQGWRFAGTLAAQTRDEAEDRLALLAARMAGGAATVPSRAAMTAGPSNAPLAPTVPRPRFSGRAARMGTKPGTEPFGPPAPAARGPAR